MWGDVMSACSCHGGQTCCKRGPTNLELVLEVARRIDVKLARFGASEVDATLVQDAQMTINVCRGLDLVEDW